ncbi:hypothetical protein [Fimbriimonas ginsengisoli]|uniref:ParE family toxin-like protein n=1 Tax=Fimbriimonas ginsengisoli TaxID=1005039 RepID=UPI000A059044
MRRSKPFAGRSLTTSAFWENFDRLPNPDQEQAREAHRQWLADPRLPGLRFKKVHGRRPIYSVRVNITVRALGVQAEGDIVWFWIGPHDEYEAILKRL